MFLICYYSNLILFFFYRQDSHTSPELLGAFPTKSATVTYLQFAQYNLLLAAGSIWERDYTKMGLHLCKARLWTDQYAISTWLGMEFMLLTRLRHGAMIWEIHMACCIMHLWFQSENFIGKWSQMWSNR